LCWRTVGKTGRQDGSGAIAVTSTSPVNGIAAWRAGVKQIHEECAAVCNDQVVRVKRIACAGAAVAHFCAGVRGARRVGMTARVQGAGRAVAAVHHELPALSD
jgi:hypothetical protein